MQSLDAAQPETKPNRGLSRRIWLLLLREGGRWRSLEVAQALPADDAQTIRQTLAAMAHSRSVRAFAVAGKQRRQLYGVTSACVVPGGVTLTDLAECGAVRLAIEEEATA